jgi:diacylglycerol kinase family enzyme
MNRRYVVLVNRRSGWRDPSFHERLEAACRERELRIVEFGPETDLRRLLREGVTEIVVAGGDGSIHHAMQSLVNTEATLSVVPCGTFNHFAKDLGIPLEPGEALEVALRGERKQIDVGRVNDRFFLNNVTFGIYPELVERREQEGRKNRWIALLKATKTVYRKFPHVNLVIEAPPIYDSARTHMFMVSNNAYDIDQSGAHAPRSSLESGRLHLYWLPHMRKWQFIWMIARFMRELAVLRSPLVFTSVPKSLTVRTPAR